MSLTAAPTPEHEDWRYVDCKPLSAEASTATTTLPGAPCAASDAPQPCDATHTWAAAGTVHRLALRGDGELSIDDHGGTWTLLLDVAPGATQRLRLRRHAASGRSSSWLHARLGRGACLEIEDCTLAADDVRLAALGADVAQDARFDVRLAQTGGRLSRHRLDVALQGTGAHSGLLAAAAPRGETQAHLLTRVVHVAATTTSSQLIKAVLRDRARTSFDGVVGMLAGADGSTATQQDRNLLLSPLARADTRPQLDIRADEVEASHGATVGALDDDELTYLRARGLPPAQAREMLTAAFLDEVLMSFTDPLVRQALHAL
jgi:Fe-S cluster assembly protein SufD